MSDYYVLITNAGAALQAAALANGTTVNLASFGIDDGNGAEITPDAAQTALVNQVYSGDISSLAVSTSDDSVLVAQCIVPATSGGYVIRGVGIFTDDGTLYAVGNFPDQSKPDADSGYAASLEILVNLAVSDTSTITLTVSAADALTEEQADQLYLRQDKKLSEIAAQGSSAQSLARANLGLGDIATQRAGNFLQVAKNLSEIADEGTDAKTAACSNIGALQTSGGTVNGPLVLSSAAPVLQLLETDTGKSYCLTLDGSGLRLNADSTSGTPILSIDGSNGAFTVTGSINTANQLFENGNRVYSPNNPQPISFPICCGDSVGATAMLYDSTAPHNFSDYVAGGYLYPSGGDGEHSTVSVSGTWVCQGQTDTTNEAHRTTIFTRIA
ncbi:phage tail protein [Klebsiella aerogenes]